MNNIYFMKISLFHLEHDSETSIHEDIFQEEWITATVAMIQTLNQTKSLRFVQRNLPGTIWGVVRI